MAGEMGQSSENVCPSPSHRPPRGASRKRTYNAANDDRANNYISLKVERNVPTFRSPISKAMQTVYHYGNPREASLSGSLHIEVLRCCRSKIARFHEAIRYVVVDCPKRPFVTDY